MPADSDDRSRPGALASSLEIAGIGLGTAPFAFGTGTRRQSIDVVHAALDHGVRLIDTAPAYTRVGEPSTAESIVREALQGRQGEGVVVATKGGHWREGDAFPIDGSAARLRQQCESSLRMLGVERIDLYQLHHVDPHVPIEESVAELARLRDEGKIDRIGLSNVDEAQLGRAQRIAEVAAVQNRLSFADPADLPMARLCHRQGIRYLAYQPLGGATADVDAGDPRLEIARAAGVSLAVVTLAWLRSLSPSIVPLVGSSRPETIVDSARSVAVALDPTSAAAISAAAGLEGP